MPKPVNKTVEFKNYVLDSYAVLAFLEAEKGSDRVKTLLEEAAQGQCGLLMSVINLGEVVYIVERERGLPRAQGLLALMEEWPLEIENIDQNLALTAAHIKAHASLAYADCFAAALAIQKKAILVTGDPEFKKLKLVSGLQIEWINPT
jgi:predicted nucleic acid-binding protein